MESFDSTYRGRKVLVTGGLGFIGSNLARRLADAGAHVLVLDVIQANGGSNRANLRGFEERLQLREADLRQIEAYQDLLQGFEVVFNLAGQVSHIDSMTDPVSDLGANVHAQIVLLEACRHYLPQAKVVFASTRQIYGRPVSVPVDETHPLKPVDVNGINKMAAEEYHSLYHRVYGMRTVSLRLTNTFGPRMRVKDARNTFLGIWIRRTVEGGVFEVWGGHQKRDLTYVDDAVDAFLAAGSLADTTGQVFNIGGIPPVSLAELADELVQLAGRGRYEVKEFPPEFLRIDIGDYFADDRRFRSLTGWAPKLSLREGLTRTIAYYKEHLSDYV